MSVVRITIKKNLASGAYAFRHSATGPFATEYLVRSKTEFPSPILKGYAWNIAHAESRLYHSCVRFDEATIKLATPGAKGQELRGEFSYIALDKLQGQLPMAEDEMLMYPPVSAVIGRQAVVGRHGRLLLPHILTTTEWNLYAQKRVIPARLQHLNGHDQTPFNRELLAAIKEDDGRFVMAPDESDTEQSLRAISFFYFHSFHVASLKTKRRKSSTAAKRRASGQIGEPGSANFAASASRSQTPVAGVVYLLQAGQHFKIGKSINFDKRLGQIKLQLPYAVQVVHVIQAANPSQVESYWHKCFATLRRNGEWFELTAAEVNEFKSRSQM